LIKISNITLYIGNSDISEIACLPFALLVGHSIFPALLPINHAYRKSRTITSLENATTHRHAATKPSIVATNRSHHLSASAASTRSCRPQDPVTIDGAVWHARSTSWECWDLREGHASMKTGSQTPADKATLRDKISLGPCCVGCSVRTDVPMRYRSTNANLL